MTTKDEHIKEWAKIVEAKCKADELLEESENIDFDEGTFIGAFTVEGEKPITEMGAVGKLSTSHRYYVYIHGRERMTPHFHVFDKEGEHKSKGQREGIHTCIKIRENQYFKHGSHTDNLDRDARHALDAFMREIRVQGKHSSNIGVTNYVHTIREWNDNNAENGAPNWVDEERKQPDYTTIT